MLCIMCGDGGFGKAKDDASLSSDETLCPNHAPAYLEYRMEIGLGDQCCWQDRCSYAIQHYDRALGIFPKSPEASYQKSIALIRLNKYNEAITCLDEWLEIKPEDATAHVNKGIALHMLGRYDDAAQCFEVGKLAMELVKHAYFHHAFVLYMTGRYQEALASCNHMLRKIPRHKATRLLKKRCRDALGLGFCNVVVC